MGVFMPIDPKKEFFCPAPWTDMYHHLDNCAPCHTNINDLKLSPEEYLKSDFLQSLKDDFTQGRVPPTCRICKDREDLGIKSTRQSIFKKKDETSSLVLHKEDFTADRETSISRLELRTSNLCNFKCRMCNAASSSEIARENKEFPILARFNEDHHIMETVESSLDELKGIALENLRTLCFTGGEPFLIKQYYDFLDLLIERGLTSKIRIELFTNCSVYNPLFMERLAKFKEVRFVMSIDGVGKTAEYQRKGTVWPTVEKNVYKFASLGKPFTLFFNTAISPYVLLDVSSLAKFAMKLYEINGGIKSKCYSTVIPESLHFRNMDMESRKRAIEQIDMAAEILTAPNFAVLKKELLDIKRNLIENDPVSPNMFINHTRILDAIRNEKFEDVFGYKLV
jgi:organic radical activating enzyme